MRGGLFLDDAPAPQSLALARAPAPQSRALARAPAPQSLALARAPAPQRLALARAPAPQRLALARTPAPGRGGPGIAQARVLALQRAAGNRAVGAVLARQPTTLAPRREPAVVSTTELGPHELRVVLDDGSRHRVKRTVKGRLVLDPGAPDISFHGDSKRAWMRISWCRGTKGTIDVGADPQDAAQQLLKKVGEAILKGGATSDVIKAIEEAQLKPFVKVDIADSRKWKISGEVQVQVNRLGVPGFEAGLTIDLGPVKIKPKVSGSDLGGKDPNITPTIDLEFELGRRAPRHDCDPKTIDILWDYTCTREKDVVNTITIQPPDIARQAFDNVHVYFPYAKSEPEMARSEGQLKALDERLNEGYRITGVDGYASPEGPQAPRPNGSFEGNRALSQARADRVLKLMQGRCMLRLRNRCIEEDAPATGQGERYPLTRMRTTRGGGAVVEEVEGRDLHKAVAEAFVNDPNEMNRLPEDEQRKIREARTDREKARLIFPWLRRAEVKLRRDWTERPAPVTIEVPDVRLDAEKCPDVVVNAADRHWGPRDPRTKTP